MAVIFCHGKQQGKRFPGPVVLVLSANRGCSHLECPIRTEPERWTSGHWRKNDDILNYLLPVILCHGKQQSQRFPGLAVILLSCSPFSLSESNKELERWRSGHYLRVANSVKTFKSGKSHVRRIVLIFMQVVVSWIILFLVVYFFLGLRIYHIYIFYGNHHVEWICMIAGAIFLFFSNCFWKK